MIGGVEYCGVVFASRHIELAEVERARFDHVRFTGTRARQVVFSDASFMDVLLGLLEAPGRPMENTCDQLLHHLSGPDNHDDVALLIAQVQPHRA